MKKILTVGTAALMALTLAACSSSTAASSTAAATTAASASASAEPTKGTYTIYNATSDSVTSLYLYPTDSTDKGTNYAGEKGLSAAHATYVTYDAGKSGVKLTLEFTTKGGYTGTFTTLSLEDAPISLLAEDAASGATNKNAIKFNATPATYTITNTTGEEVKELYIYPTGSSDKGENRVGTAAQADGKQVVTIDDASSLIKADGSGINHFTIEFTTASGATGSYDNLSYETAGINLLKPADVASGATQIQFVAAK